MLDYMHLNKAYLFNKINDDKKNEIFLKNLKDNYLKYRNDWKNQPKRIINDKLTNTHLKSNKIFPLCVDIETAAVCDLACPHCYRQFVTTQIRLFLIIVLQNYWSSC